MKDAAELLSSIEQVVQEELNAVSTTRKTVEILAHERPHYNWVGIYLLEGDTLVLGPYVGKPTEHTRIPLGKGICGAAAASGQTLVVDDVTSDPRYLACSLETRSEIVVPITTGGRVLGEIDIDSDTQAAFSEEDRHLLEAAAAILAPRLERAGSPDNR